jgi:hypothetical protein
MPRKNHQGLVRNITAGLTLITQGFLTGNKCRVCGFVENLQPVTYHY